jgi:hypothetical protein
MATSTNATGKISDVLIAIIFMLVVFISSIMVLLGACRLVFRTSSGSFAGFPGTQQCSGDRAFARHHSARLRVEPVMAPFANHPEMRPRPGKSRVAREVTNDVELTSTPGNASVRIYQNGGRRLANEVTDDVPVQQ